jgi:hypothetical protein
MYDLSRRNLLQTLLGTTGLLAASTGAKAFWAGSSPNTTGTLNLHFRGPFAYLFFQKLKKVLVLAPKAPFHHLPEITWESGELPLQGKDYELCGFTSSSSAASDPPRPYPYGSSGPNRLNVPAKQLQLDQTSAGKLVDAEGRRFFSLRVPVPDIVVPGHVTQVHLQGANAPASSSGPDLYPVGLTFIYTNVPLSDVALLTNNCANNCGGASCTLGLVPLPGQTHADVSVQMDPSEDEDPNHSFGAEAFDACRDLFRNVKLDVQLCYSATCLRLTNAESMKMQNTQVASQDASFRETSFPFTHTGADCHAPVIEITGAADDLALGSRS